MTTFSLGLIIISKSGQRTRRCWLRRAVLVLFAMLAAPLAVLPVYAASSQQASAAVTSPGESGVTVAQRDIVVGIQQLDYYPHFDFSSGQKRGYFYELMQLFGRTRGYQIRFMPLPVKRLYQELDDGLDLVYPDNPAWQNHQPDSAKVFSDPVVYTLGSSLVLPAKAHYKLEDVRTVALIHGYTPTKWLQASRDFSFEMIDVADTAGALGLVLKGRVDATPVELNVARAWLARRGTPHALVVAKGLPFTQLPFLLSTTRQPALIVEFNGFLREQAMQVAALKKRYQLQESRPE